MLTNDDFSQEFRENGFVLPKEYFRLAELGFSDFSYWRYVLGDEFSRLYLGVNRSYTNRLVVPFSWREDNDDIYCFFVNTNRNEESGKILLIHLGIKPGHEVLSIFASPWDWLRSCIEEVIAIEQ